MNAIDATMAGAAGQRFPARYADLRVMPMWSLDVAC
jgi:hypothetical protein